PVRSEVETRSFRLSFKRFEQLADGAQLFGRRLASGKSLHDELRRRASESAIDEISEELPLRLLFAVAGLVNVSPLGLVADDESFFGHDLQQLEDCCVFGCLRA